MKSILSSLGCFLIFSSTVLGQSRFSIAPTTGFVYSTYSYQTHSIRDGSTFDARGHSNASSVGLNVRYHLDTKWAVSFGLLYNHINSAVQGSPITTTNFSGDKILFPVLANYRFSNKRLSPYFSIGPLFSKNKSDDSEPIKLNGLIGIGIDYQIRPKYSLLLQPTVSYLLSKPNSTAVYSFDKFQSYQFGLQAQLIWKL